MRAAGFRPWRRAVLLAPRLLHPSGGTRKEGQVNENDHPKGALLFMLVYLALLAFMWTNLYLKLWTR